MVTLHIEHFSPFWYWEKPIKSSRPVAFVFCLFSKTSLFILFLICNKLLTLKCFLLKMIDDQSLKHSKHYNDSCSNLYFKYTTVIKHAIINNDKSILFWSTNVLLNAWCIFLCICSKLLFIVWWCNLIMKGSTCCAVPFISIGNILLFIARFLAKRYWKRSRNLSLWNQKQNP